MLKRIEDPSCVHKNKIYIIFLVFSMWPKRAKRVPSFFYMKIYRRYENSQWYFGLCCGNSMGFSVSFACNYYNITSFRVHCVFHARTFVHPMVYSNMVFFFFFSFYTLFDMYANYSQVRSNYVGEWKWCILFCPTFFSASFQRKQIAWENFWTFWLLLFALEHFVQQKNAKNSSM